MEVGRGKAEWTQQAGRQGLAYTGNGLNPSPKAVRMVREVVRFLFRDSPGKDGRRRPPSARRQPSAPRLCS